MNSYEKELLERVSHIEKDVAFIKGVIEGRDHTQSRHLDKVSIFLSVVAVLSSLVLVIDRVFL